PECVGWKLVAVNLSDLAAKGATPTAALLSLTLTGDGAWEAAFIDGIEAACERHQLPLIGGDTIALPPGAARVLGMTAIGKAGPKVPSRGGGEPSDRLWLVGAVGNSAAGLAQLRHDEGATGALVEAYRRPVPLLEAGQALAPHANAMLDISDGLLIDALRLAEASGCIAAIDLGAIGLSPAFVAVRGDSLEARLFAASGGDDYALLAALPQGIDPAALDLPSGTPIACVGTLEHGPGALTLSNHGQAVALPRRLGHEHDC
ncbi:MAG: thiamine-phosphate kinase, partial [Sphingomicrobium sp.]